MSYAAKMKVPSDSLYLASWVLSLNQSQQPADVQDGLLPDGFQDFDFLEGEFDGVEQRPDGLKTISWKSERMLNGWVIRDEIKEYDSRGVLTSDKVIVRTYSKDHEEWKAVQIDLRTNKLTNFTGFGSGNTVIMECERDLARPGLEARRQVFVIQGEKRFTLIEQVSTDNGDTWQEERRPMTLHKIL
jgi:hypothetical protein